jgi:hypothetical protein
MTMIERTSAPLIVGVIETLNKMVFVSGPRQMGKNILAKKYLEHFGQSLYVNWDSIPHSKKLAEEKLTQWVISADRWLSALP